MFGAMLDPANNPFSRLKVVLRVDRSTVWLSSGCDEVDLLADEGLLARSQASFHRKHTLAVFDFGGAVAPPDSCSDRHSAQPVRRKSRDRKTTGREKPGRQAIQRTPSGDGPAPSYRLKSSRFAQ